jgi:hypothetical protein
VERKAHRGVLRPRLPDFALLGGEILENFEAIPSYSDKAPYTDKAVVKKYVRIGCINSEILPTCQ